MLFEGFESKNIETADTTIFCRVGGDGPPLLLLHGCPQTHVMWNKVAPTLARHFTVVAADLRGYGKSGKPTGLPSHENYSFRAMANDQISVMSRLGFETFSAIGHDRGARVLHRMCLDHPRAVKRVVLLDILPTSYLYENTNKQFATSYWEWFFFTQEAPFPEAILSSNPDAFLRHELSHLLEKGIISDDVWNEYLTALSSFEAMHGMCEDYRAGATIDLRDDSMDAGRKIEADLLLLWGNDNPIWERFQMMDVWKRFASRVRGHALDCGHYLAEEEPDDVLSSALLFLKP